jgi:nucleotide-binding universal stress UspA family protein
VQAREKPSTILIPLDGSGLAENALTIGVELAAAFGADVSLLRSTTAAVYAGAEYGPSMANAWDQAIKSQQKEAGDYLDSQAASIKDSVSSVSTHVSSDTGASAIVDTLHDSPSTIAIMVTHGRGGIRRIVLGSVTDKVPRSSRAPTLVIPANSMPDAGDAESDV